jgi:type IV pilus assembly protein PilQ
MKTRTLILAAALAGVFLFVRYIPRGTAGDDVVIAAPLAWAAAAAPAVEPILELARVEPAAESYAAETGTTPAPRPAASADAEEAETIQLQTERTLAPGIEVSMGDEGRDLISITLDDVPLQDVVRMFTRISGANIVAGTNLQGSVTVSLRDVEWEPAFRVILDSSDMVLVEKTPGIYTIMSKKDLAAEPVTVDTVFLSYTTVSNVLPVVERMLISSNASVAAFPSANALVIQETVARLNTIKEVIKKIDQPRPQVYIEAKFVELNDQAIKDLGIDWSVLGSDGSGSLGYSLTAGGLTRSYTETRRRNSADSVVDFDVTRYLDTSQRQFYPAPSASRNRSDVLSGTEATLGGRNFTEFDATEDSISVTPLFPFESTTIQGAILSAADFAVTLSALKQNNGVDIISNPKVIVANEETATIHVGQNEPNVVAVPQGDTGDRFAYALDDDRPFIELGVKLEVTPTVNTENNITVRLVPELSRLLGQKTVGEGATQISFPRTQIRKISTLFNLESGSTVAIGGLTETTDVESVKKIPLLGDIPVIGKYLFRHTHTEKKQDEVIIFVTVGMANPDSLVEVAGIPSEGKLVHKYLADKAEKDSKK